MTQDLHDKLRGFTDSCREEALELLARLVEIQSGSRNKAGVDRMAAEMAAELGKVLPEAKVLPFTEVGDMVQAMTGSAAEGRPGIVLVGHMDTVFPEDTAFRHFHQDGAHIHGPGVYDMKGGLVVALYALKALDHLGMLAELPVTVLCNSDEEIGSPASRTWIEEMTRNALAALVFEGAGADRDVVTGRKGRLGLRLKVHGRAGHAAAGGEKASAILEMAHKVVALENLNGVAGVTLNVGQISGGIGPNTVAELAEAEIDVRVPDQRAQNLIEEALDGITARSVVPGTRAELLPVGGRPPMPQSEANRQLHAVAKQQASILGYDLPEELRSGVSDANFIGALGVPVLDGLGPAGGLDHSDREYIVENSLSERATLTAAIIAAIFEQASGQILSPQREI